MVGALLALALCVSPGDFSPFRSTPPADGYSPFGVVVTAAPAPTPEPAPPCDCNGTCQPQAVPALDAGLPSRPVDEYTAARAAHLRTREPLAVLVGADWCGPCQTAKAILPRLTIPHAHLDVDREPNTVREACVGIPAKIPTLLIFRIGKPTERYTGGAAIRWLQEHAK